LTGQSLSRVVKPSLHLKQQERKAYKIRHFSILCGKWKRYLYTGLVHLDCSIIANCSANGYSDKESILGGSVIGSYTLYQYTECIWDAAKHQEGIRKQIAGATWFGPTTEIGFALGGSLTRMQTHFCKSKSYEQNRPTSEFCRITVK